MKKGIAIGLKNKHWHERNGIKRKRRALRADSRRKALLLGSAGATAPQVIKESEIEQKIQSQNKKMSIWQRLGIWFNNSILR